MEGEALEFPEGIFAKAPAEGLPDFYKTKLLFKLDEAIPWFKSKQDSGDIWVTLDIREAQSGHWYASVNPWKPDPAFSKRPTRPTRPVPPVPDDDMPW